LHHAGRRRGSGFDDGIDPDGSNFFVETFQPVLSCEACLDCLHRDSDLLPNLVDRASSVYVGGSDPVTAYQRRAAPCARIKHLVTCRSQ
jgi:hypothetical protein